MERSRYRDAIAGFLAAGVALGVAELVAGLTGGTSLIVAVGNVVVDNTPGSLVKAAIDALGSNDKPALLLTITVVALLLGAALGPAAGRRPSIGAAAFAVFGLIGAMAGAAEPFTSTFGAFLTAGLAAAAGFLSLRVLLEAAAPREVAPEPVVMPGRGVAGRRQFLAFGGAAAGAAVASAFVGRRILGPSVDVEAQRSAVVLPPTDLGATLPEGGFDVEGISSLITPNSEFYRIDTAFVVPRVDTSSWRLKVTGMVDEPYELTFDELIAMPLMEEPVTLSCVSNEVGGDLVGNAIWRGVSLPAILERAGVQEGATQIVGRSVDGFTVGFPTDVALDGRAAMVAVAMNGEPLPADHGFPARLIVPGLYGYVSATKWLGEIELTTLDAFDAYWIPRGWAKEAPIKTQARIDKPRNGRTIKAGSSVVAGVAWAGIRSVERVEVRIAPRDNEANGEWREAQLGEALSSSTWRQWLLPWDASPGEYQIEVRATDGDGNVQTADRHEPAPDGATGHHTINVRVS
ncbi:MAG: molybdopterin-dependent oxidoreductase [Dehalococcoidia bacterium]